MRNNPLDESKLPITQSGTESQSVGSHRIKYPFGRYEVIVELASDGKFIGISEISVNKDFRRYEQRITKKGYLDVSDVYEEEK